MCHLWTNNPGVLTLSLHSALLWFCSYDSDCIYRKMAAYFYKGCFYYFVFSHGVNIEGK